MRHPSDSSIHRHLDPTDKLGICEWFHFRDSKRLHVAARQMREAGVRHLRTGVSWADYFRPGGVDWFAEVFETLQEFELLVSLWHTPPSISENGQPNGPPRNLDDFASFVWTVCNEFGDQFEWVELWNEPNGHHYWDFIACDPGWDKFATMIRSAAWTARAEGKRSILGGVAPADPYFVGMMGEKGALEFVDAVGVHGFPEMWGEGFAGAEGGADVADGWDEPWRWNGWRTRIDSIAAQSGGRPVWITETGLATWDPVENRRSRYDLQRKLLSDAAAAPCERVYWYSWHDLDPGRAAVEGFHEDENEYHFGLYDAAGKPKPALATFRDLLTPNRSRPARR